MGCIYKIVNKVNGKTYVGQTTRLAKYRFRQHISDSKKIENKDILLYRAFNKYGIDNFLFEVVEDGIPNELLDEKEVLYIKKYNSYVEYGCGYNLTIGGHNTRTHFNISLKQLEEIKKDIKYSNLSIQDIAIKYKQSRSSIQAICNGRSYRQDDEVYPLRNKIINSQIKIESKEQYLQLLQDIENCDLSFNDIANKWNLSIQTIRRFNEGISDIYNNRYKDINDKFVFPIRIGKKVSQKMFESIIYDACYNIPTKDLVTKYSLSKRMVNSILSGECLFSDKLAYPIRKNQEYNLKQLKTKHRKEHHNDIRRSL